MICFVFQTGQLNEYTERKEMNADVICMALGRVPPGEQRSRFLAVGLYDNTVRIISLDPNVRYLPTSFRERDTVYYYRVFETFCRTVCPR